MPDGFDRLVREAVPVHRFARCLVDTHHSGTVHLPAYLPEGASSLIVRWRKIQL